MDDVFNEQVTDDKQPQVPADQQQGESQQQQPETGAEAGSEGTPTSQPNTEKHVPLAALEAVRTERKDWKEKALRLEGEVNALRQQRQAQPEQPQEIDPIQANVIRTESLFLDASERVAIKEHGKEVVDKAFARYQEEAAKNPALAHQMRVAADPYGEIVKWSKQREMLDEIGTDPQAYRAKLEAEIRASLQSKPPETRLPQSLAGERSAGSRGSTWTGPPPLESLFPQ